MYLFKRVDEAIGDDFSGLKRGVLSTNVHYFLAAFFVVLQSVFLGAIRFRNPNFGHAQDPPFRSR